MVAGMKKNGKSRLRHRNGPRPRHFPSKSCEMRVPAPHQPQHMHGRLQETVMSNGDSQQHGVTRADPEKRAQYLLRRQRQYRLHHCMQQACAATRTACGSWHQSVHARRGTVRASRRCTSPRATGTRRPCASCSKRAPTPMRAAYTDGRRCTSRRGAAMRTALTCCSTPVRASPAPPTHARAAPHEHTSHADVSKNVAHESRKCELRKP